MKTALIIFTKEPLLAKVKTRLAKSIGEVEALELYKLILEQILGLQVEASKLVFVEAYTPTYQKHFDGLECFIQVGEDIGQKMANAFEKVFENGYEKAILVGGDIPLLDEGVINEAFEFEQAVLNPSRDGGYYLIGFHKECFSQKAFEIDFSKEVFSQTLQALEPLHVKIGKELFDVDVLEDLRSFDTLNLQSKLALHVKSFLATLPRISVIIPVYYEKENLPKTLKHLRANARENNYEIIIVDTPLKTTIEDIETTNLRTTCAPKAGRAYQLNEGAKRAKGEILLFLHADTLVPKEWDLLIKSLHVKDKNLAGAFKLGIKTKNLLIKVIEFLANLRVVFTNTPYGDQAQFISSQLFNKVGGYDEIPLMEDVAIIKKIHQQNLKVEILKQKVQTSDRRWHKEGIIYTSLRNRVLSTLYFFGVSAKRLKNFYKF
ncbi:MAG TPA: hypothetical protein CFH82_10120 [Sulfurospirillum sp. UBA12182]|nr:MAG TPA: hypothetical protein CFH82_10120 [Sulfurospirillum sp. UBA12182]